MENISKKLKIEKITICSCGHSFKYHTPNGCYAVHGEHGADFCICAYDEFEAKLHAYESQLDQVLKVLNNR